MFEMSAGLDPLPIPPNDDILLPDDDIPPPPVQKPKAKRKRKEIKFLTEDELARLFSAIHSVRDRAIFQLAYRAGLRASEVGLLQLRDYDPKADRIFIHRLKGSNFRPSPSDARGSSGAPRLVESARQLPRADLPVQAEAADRPNHAPSLDEEVRRRGRHPAAPPAFPRAQTLLRHAFIEQGVRRGAGPGLDRTREHSIDHGVRQGDQRATG